MAYFDVSSLEWLCLRIHGLCCGEERYVGVRKNTWHTLR